MSNQKQELIRSIAYEEKKFFIFQSYANYWQASAMTGACKLRDVANLNGIQHTNEQKVRDALNTMLRHIHRMQETAETISSMQEELDKLNV
jgi:hypothetical protein